MREGRPPMAAVDWVLLFQLVIIQLIILYTNISDVMATSSVVILLNHKMRLAFLCFSLRPGFLEVEAHGLGPQPLLPATAQKRLVGSIRMIITVDGSP
jgi:hypothetical protein